MKIESSSINMSSRHDLIEKYEKKESLRMWTGNTRPDFEGRGLSPEPQAAVKVSISGLPENNALVKAQKDIEDSTGTMEPSPEDKIKLLLVEAMMEALTGKKVKLTIAQVPDPKAADNTVNAPQQNSIATAQPEQQKQGWGIEYDSHESYQEKETLSFNAAGVIRTSEGKEIQFSAELNLKREFITENNISLRAGDAKKIDPLIINFDGAPAQLTDKKFSFDLNSDGSKENISFVKPGSGFLVLDTNNDGKANNGKELFGPNSGNGFKELANYDEDGNQWIDEKDPVYSKLRIWSKDDKENDSLFSLAEKNIAALYLGNISAKFSIKDPQNSLQGENRNAGIFINENGTAGTMQQIDLIA